MADQFDPDAFMASRQAAAFDPDAFMATRAKKSPLSEKRQRETMGGPPKREDTPGEKFGAGVTAGLLSPMTMMGALAKDPVGTIRGIPGGIGDAINGLTSGNPETYGQIVGGLPYALAGSPAMPESVSPFLKGATRAIPKQVRPLLSGVNPLEHPLKILPDIYDAGSNVVQAGKNAVADAQAATRVGASRTPIWQKSQLPPKTEVPMDLSTRLQQLQDNPPSMLPSQVNVSQDDPMGIPSTLPSGRTPGSMANAQPPDWREILATAPKQKAQPPVQPLESPSTPESLPPEVKIPQEGSREWHAQEAQRLYLERAKAKDLVIKDYLESKGMSADEWMALTPAERAAQLKPLGFKLGRDRRPEFARGGVIGLPPKVSLQCGR